MTKVDGEPVYIRTRDDAVRYFVLKGANVGPTTSVLRGIGSARVVPRETAGQSNGNKRCVDPAKVARARELKRKRRKHGKAGRRK